MAEHLCGKCALKFLQFLVERDAPVVLYAEWYEANKASDRDRNLIRAKKFRLVLDDDEDY